MAANINLVNGISFSGVNEAANTTPLSIALSGITYVATAYYYNNFFQATTSPTTVALPAATVYVCYVRNLDSTNNLSVNFTPNGGTASSLVLTPYASGSFGGFFCYFNTATTAGGITALTLTASSSTVAAEVLLAF
jgi:hypothetical protein